MTTTTLRFAIALAMVSALGPFSFDTYLPSFPSIATSMHTDIKDISLSVSLYVFGLALGQLSGGPLSDRWGRVRVMTAGLILFSAASIFLIFSHTLTELLLGRAFQALGGGCCGVGVPAIIRDSAEGKEAAKLFSMVTLMMIVAPALAPSIGSLILSVAPWQAIFLFLAVYALIVMLALRSWVFPTLAPPTQHATKKINFFLSYLAVLKTPRAIAFVLLQTSTYCILLIFLTHASFIYQVWFHLSKFTFAGLFACNIAMMALLNLSGRFLLRWLEPIQILTLAVFLQATAVLAWLFFAWFNLSLVFIVPTIMVSIGCISVISPNVQACYLLSFKENSATAAALMGSVQLIIAGFVSLLSVFLANNQLWPIAAVMAGCMLVAIGLITRVWGMETRVTIQ